MAEAPVQAVNGVGASTEVLYLSGTGKDDTVNWSFYCTGGRNSGKWTRIPVPSCWEQEGFGDYNYGLDYYFVLPMASEKGMYKYNFSVPAAWSGKKVYIVFEGSMTDTEARINGISAGPKHQGSFYRFKYNITGLLNFGQSNLLEATVGKMSSDDSVNAAERRGDYWVFGGIYRPVYLEAYPPEYIDRVAINAKANGSFSMDVFLGGKYNGTAVTAQIKDLNGTAVGSPFVVSVPAGQNKTTLSTQVASPRTWTAETPELYEVTVTLAKGGNATHTIKQRFGFRTIEVRAGDGIYVNGKKIMLKGINRHSFYPDSGRTTSTELTETDINLIKDMNMNAVRMSHYPPDQHFLDACDEAGLYVLDELAGWHGKYSTGVGKKLVEEMVVRDVNHPSIIFWDNGNEGGFNTDLDGEYGKWDPQNRSVLHPWETFSNVNTQHYPTYDNVKAALEINSTIYMPTEFLHALYDGGAGAGLNDYWKLMLSKPLSAGGFIWAFLDEGINRTDTGEIDTEGSWAPDGVVGPYRQKEGSFYAIKEIWAPIYINMTALPAGFNGKINLSNRYDFTNLNQCTFQWKLADFPEPSSKDTGYVLKKQGTLAGPSIPPGGSGKLNISLPSDWLNYDMLSLTAKDPSGREVYTWTWTIKKASDHRSSIVSTGSGNVSASEDWFHIILTAGETVVSFSKIDGALSEVKYGGQKISLGNGPVLASGISLIKSLRYYKDGSDYVLEANYSGNLNYVRWRLHGSGWLRLDYKYNLHGDHDYPGVNFDYPEEKVEGIKWLGRGPYRVWKNRMQGVSYSVWEKGYKDTETGYQLWDYPEFKGYYADTYWAVLETQENNITVVSENENLFLRLFTPEDGPENLLPPMQHMYFPAGGISFLDGISPIAQMGIYTIPLYEASDFGPEGEKNHVDGEINRTLYFKFGPLPSTSTTTSSTTTSSSTSSTTSTTSSSTTSTITTSTTSTSLPPCVVRGCGSTCQNDCNSQYSAGQCDFGSVLVCMNSCPACSTTTSSTSSTSSTSTSTSTSSSTSSTASTTSSSTSSTPSSTITTSSSSSTRVSTTTSTTVTTTSSSSTSTVSTTTTSTTVPMSYCSSASVYSSEYISRVRLNSGDRSSNASNYSDYTGTIYTTLKPGQGYALYVDGRASGYYNEYLKAWIDYNRDGDFNDSGEEINFGSRVFSGAYTFSKNFTVPAGAGLGNTRMRISLKYGSAPASCGSLTYGEVEDYTVQISQTATTTTAGSTTTTTTGSTTTTTSQCTLPGDNPPCQEVILSEVVAYINLWSTGQVPLEEVVDLIIVWSSGGTY